MAKRRKNPIEEKITEAETADLIRRFRPLLAHIAASELTNGDDVVIACEMVAEQWRHMPEPLGRCLAEFSRLKDAWKAAQTSRRAIHDIADARGAAKMEAAETLDGKLAEYLLLMLRVNPRFAEIAQQCEVSPQDKDRVRMAATRATGLRKNDGACLMATCWAIYPLWLCDDAAGPMLLNAAVSKAEIGERGREAWRKARTMCGLYRRRTPGIVVGGENGLRLTPQCRAELSKNGADLGLVEAALTMLLKPAE